MDGKEFAEKLRVAADWFEAHPDVPVPDELRGDVWLSTREAFADVTRKIGGAEKDTSGHVFWLRKALGVVRMDYNITRTEVCERRVVGTREVAERVIPAHVEEIEEWECRSILAEDAAP